MAQSQFVTVETFQDFLQAEAARTSLEAGGIQAFLKNEYAVSMMPHLSQSLGGIELQVPTHQEQEAREILTQFAQAVDEVPITEGARVSEIKLHAPASADLKRALFSVLFGSLILPVIMNGVSFWLLVRTYRRDRSSLREHPVLYFVTVALNLAWVSALVLTFYRMGSN